MLAIMTLRGDEGGRTRGGASWGSFPSKECEGERLNKERS